MRKQQPLDDGDDQECAPLRDLGAKLDEEDDEDENDDDEDDCFFESLDRVPSGVSFDFGAPSSSSDGDDDDDDDEDARFSFASAVAPPSDFGRLSISISDLDDDDDDGEHNGSHGFDYGIWMAEPISIQERRRLLFQGLGFTSSREIPVPPPTSPPSAATEAVAAPEVRGIGARSRRRLSLKFSEFRLSSRIESHPSSSPSQPTLARSRSDCLIVPRDSEALLRRCSSAPSSLSNRVRVSVRVREGISPEGGESLDFPADGGVCRIKNLDTGKEFVVSEVKKDGTWGRLNDLQTGLQLTLEEFERFLGYSPIVKELMRRVKLGGGSGNDNEKGKDALGDLKSLKSSGGKRKGGGWLKNIKFVASSVTGLISERDREWGPNSSMKRSPSSRGGSEWLKVHQHGKSYKELTGLYMCQQIQAHQGAIWCIKFSSDSQYLASAGEDRVVHVWQVVESDVSSALVHQGSRSSLPPLPDSNGAPNRSARLSAPPSKRTRKGKVSSRSSVPEYIVMPEAVFMLAEKPVCSFEGHLDDILDLSWSKSQYLLSSSMDKTVRLWDMESKSCLKLFAHNDYVTCIQFNPVDDMYFISGSLDGKVRIWSIRDRQVVDWSDLHEMVTAVSYTPDGQGALVGSHKGSCRFYKKTDCKLDQKSQVDIWSKKRKSHAKKITGFQFAPDNPFEVLITSADSQIRVFDGVDMIHKFRGFRNTSSQISASYTSDGRFVVCASEDSHVYVWKRDAGGGGKSKGLVTTRSHEHFYCKDVSVAIPWTGSGSNCSPQRLNRHHQNQQLLDSQRSNSTTTLEELFPSSRTHCPLPLPKKNSADNSTEQQQQQQQQQHRSSSSLISSSSSQRSDASGASSSSSSSWGWYNGGSSRTSSPEPANAWGLVVVTGGLGGEIKIYQNFGLPLRLSRQTNLF